MSPLNCPRGTADQALMARRGQHRSRPATALPGRRRAGLTLIECIVATMILSAAVVAIMTTLAAGHHHLGYAQVRCDAIHLAEDLLEETVPAPYAGGGPDRAAWGLDGYHGFHEPAGGQRDFAGALYPQELQGFQRSASVQAAEQVIPELDGFAVPGKVVEVTVSGVSGAAGVAGSGQEQWKLARFVPEPLRP